MGHPMNEFSTNDTFSDQKAVGPMIHTLFQTNGFSDQWTNGFGINVSSDCAVFICANIRNTYNFVYIIAFIILSIMELDR